MRSLVRIRFGSHLYGTATPASDLDVKSVYVPDARSILLQRVKGSISTKREKSQGEKNHAGDVDEEAFSLQRYLGLLAEGQTVATDLLFAPEASMLHPPAAEWAEIVANRQRLITSKSAAFVDYCRQQANKYSMKGSRVAAARSALTLLDRALEAFPASTKLSALADRIADLVAATQHMSIVAIDHISGTRVDHWEVCGKKMSYQASIKSAREMMASLVGDYGHRALQAESQQGVDWKALSHAVRIAKQGIELLLTGRVTFPLPDAAHILAIKTGQVPYAEVAAEIEQGLVEVEQASAISKLPAQPDFAWIDDFVARVYGAEVCAR